MTNVATSDRAVSGSFADPRAAIDSQLSTLASCGEETRPRVAELQAQAGITLDLLEQKGDPDAADEAAALLKLVQVLADDLREDRSDQCVARILFAVDGHLKRGPSPLGYVADNIPIWLDAHRDEPKKFSYCLRVVPPAGISIERVLNAGAQKQVFVASWPEVTPHKVAFKQFCEADGSKSGDTFSHPLRGHHPNIIETFTVGNPGDGEDTFLVERLLSTTLSYGWDFGGLGEIVNLIRDIAHALSFVHGYNRIHGDVKLENIGFEDLYILLDFGLCRSEPTDNYAWTPTGNVRALAPELLHGHANTASSDVWALGSVAFAALTGQPPFFEPDEKQHGFAKAERDRVLGELAERADDSRWMRGTERRLAAAVPELELRELLMDMLESDPARRPTARQVFDRCNKCLAQFLRPVQTTVRAAPEEELKSLLYLQDYGGLPLAGRSQRRALADTAEHIDTGQLSDRGRLALTELKAEIEPR